MEVKHKNAGLPSIFIHPSNLGGKCKTTLVSFHRKRSLLFLYFPVGNSVCQLFAPVYFKNTFFILLSSFLSSLLSEISKQNVNSVSRLSNSSLFVVVMFPPRRPYRVRALVTIGIGAKNGVLDPVYPLSCLPSWSKPLSYRKLLNTLGGGGRVLLTNSFWVSITTETYCKKLSQVLITRLI